MEWEAVAKLNDGIFSRAMTVQRLLRRNATEFIIEPLAQIVLLAKKLEPHFTSEQLQHAADSLARQRANLPSVELNVTDGYGLWAEQYDTEKNPLICIEEPAMLELIGDVAGLNVLDAACGTGRYALRLAQLGARVYGVDVTKEMLAIAQAKQAAAGCAIDFRQADLVKLPFPAEFFDLVTCALALCHVKPLDEVAAEFGRVLRPGGRALISVFHPFCLQVGWRALFMRAGTAYFIENQYHLIQDYVEALRANGFEITKLREEVVDERLLAIWPKYEVERFWGFPAALIIEAVKKGA